MDGPRILLIDDDQGLRKTLADILSARGYEVLTARCGAEGLAMARERSVNLALIDLGLPDTSGIDVLKRIRADHPAMAAIILTGSATLGSAVEATNQGAFSYLLKPYDVDQLLVNIKRALERQNADEQVLRRSADLERSNEELKALREISEAIGKTLDLRELLSEALGVFVGLRTFSFAVKGAIFLAEGEKLRLASSVGFSEAATLECGSVPFGKCLCGLAAATREVIVSRDSEKDGRHTTRLPQASPHAHIAIPLKTGGKLVGVLVLYAPPDAKFDDGLVGLCVAAGSQLATAVENATLFEATKSSSLHDALTGLANRRFLEAQLPKAIESARRYERQLSVIMLDVDHFKRYNDAHGHVEGDKVLKALADTLLIELRRADFVFRYGGEEFLVVLPETGLPMACQVAERLRRAVEAATGVTVSLGVASYGDAGEVMESLIGRADDALYRAKRKGRNRVEGDHP